MQLFGMAGRKPITPEQEPAIMAALALRPLRDFCLIVLGLNSGFRITELLALNVSDIWSSGRVRSCVSLNRARLKGGKGPYRRSVTCRTVPLNPTATAAVERYLFARFGSSSPVTDEPLFPSRRTGMRLSRWRANVIVHEVLQAAGYDDTGDGTHSLRKRFANAVYSATGRDLNLTRAIMGHRHAATTVAYLSVSESEMTSVVMSLGTVPQGTAAAALGSSGRHALASTHCVS